MGWFSDIFSSGDGASSSKSNFASKHENKEVVHRSDSYSGTSDKHDHKWSEVTKDPKTGDYKNSQGYRGENVKSRNNKP